MRTTQTSGEPRIKREGEKKKRRMYNIYYQPRPSVATLNARFFQRFLLPTIIKRIQATLLLMLC